jgi:hypothetical protein
MSNLTIIADDKAVYLDGGVLTNLDFSNAGIPDNVHALQWKTNVGWIEFIDNSDGTKSANNEIINALPDWANVCVAVFNAQVEKNKFEARAQIQEQQAAAAQNQPQTSGTMVI